MILSRAKIHMPPVRPDLVKRMHLIGRLNDGLYHDKSFLRRVSLISAPAGYGKTTLARQWMNCCEFRGTWLSLDEGDNDPALFWNYFIATIQTIDKSLGRNLMTYLMSFTLASGDLSSKFVHPSENLITDLINDLMEISDPVVVILDDLYLITDSNILNSIVFFIENLPSKIHLMITTRNDPPWPLVRWRARGEMIEIRQEDLRFNEKEASSFLHDMMHLELSSTNISSLTSRTEGWVTGLQMAAISMRGKDDYDAFTKAFTGSHRFVMDYLREEVLLSLPEQIKNFLLDSSVLSSFTCSLCDAVTESKDSLMVIDMLENSNLFIIPLDDERKWYRYHALFADLLYQQLQLTKPELVPELNLRASRWYYENEFYAEAVDRALKANDLERASELLDMHINILWQQCGYIRVNQWLEMLPDVITQKRPLLCLMQAIMYLMSAQTKKAEERLLNAEKYIELQHKGALEQGNQVEENISTNLFGMAAIIHAYMGIFKGDETAIDYYSRQALQYLPLGNIWRCSALITLGDALENQGNMDGATEVYLEALNEGKSMINAFCVLFAGFKFGLHLLLQGNLEEVAKLCKSELAYAEDNSFSVFPRAGGLWGLWGEILRERGRLDLALEYAQKGYLLSKSEETVFAWCSLCLMKVLYSMKEYEEAEKKLQELEILMVRYNLPIWLVNFIAAFKVRLSIATGDVKSLDNWVMLQKQKEKLKFSPSNDSLHLVLIRAMLATGQREEALQYANSLYDAANKGKRLKTSIEVLVLKSRILQELNNEDNAFFALIEALKLSETEGYYQIFIEDAQYINGLLQKAMKDKSVMEYVRSLVSSHSSSLHNKSNSPNSLIEPLSNRELEILELMAEGITNQSIAKRLFLSISTVKWHTSNIYGKLGVENRISAVTHARELGVIK